RQAVGGCRGHATVGSHLPDEAAGERGGDGAGAVTGVAVLEGVRPSERLRGTGIPRAHCRRAGTRRRRGRPTRELLRRSRGLRREGHAGLAGIGGAFLCGGPTPRRRGGSHGRRVPGYPQPAWSSVAAPVTFW